MFDHRLVPWFDETAKICLSDIKAKILGHTSLSDETIDLIF